MQRGRSVRGRRVCHDASAAPRVSRASAAAVGAEAAYSHLGFPPPTHCNFTSSSPLSPPPPPTNFLHRFLLLLLLLLLYHLPVPPHRFPSSPLSSFFSSFAQCSSAFKLASSATSLTPCHSIYSVSISGGNVPNGRSGNAQWRRLQLCQSVQPHGDLLINFLTKKGKSLTRRPSTTWSGTPVCSRWQPSANQTSTSALPPFPELCSLERKLQNNHALSRD